MPNANGAGSIAVHATDALRFGYCLLHQGKWAENGLFPDTPGGAAVIEAFRRAGLASPVSITTFSVHLRSILAMSGRFIAVLPVSILRFNPGFYSLRELPLDVPMPQPPALIVTLRNRTLSPPVERFVECAREVAKAMHAQPSARKAAAAAATPTAARRR
jgi:DNA-binding transcriptional LysR family regulator